MEHAVAIRTHDRQVCEPGEGPAGQPREWGTVMALGHRGSEALPVNPNEVLSTGLAGQGSSFTEYLCLLPAH